METTYTKLDGTEEVKIVDLEHLSRATVESYTRGYNCHFPEYDTEEHCFKLSAPYHGFGVHDTLVLEIDLDDDPVEVALQIMECAFTELEYELFDSYKHEFSRLIDKSELKRGRVVVEEEE